MKLHSMGAVVMLALLLCPSCNIAHAQQPDVRPYETEEDLWEALRENEITFGEFLDLLEMYRIGADDVVLPQSDWEQLPGSDAGYLVKPDSVHALTDYTPIPAQTQSPQNRRLRYQIRFGYDADMVAPTGGDQYALGRFRYGGDWSALLDGERNSGERTTWRRRSVTWSPGHWQLQYGNIEPRWGRGLVVGRSSRFLTGGTRSLSGSFENPSRSRFDGLSVLFGQGTRFSGGVLLSGLAAGVFRDKVAGLHAEYGRELWRVGVAHISGTIKKDISALSISSDSSQTEVRSPGTQASFSRDPLPAFRTGVSSVHLHLGNDRRAFVGEIAVTDNDATAKAAEVLWPITGGRLHARAWSYGTRFVNPWGGGPAHSDRESVVLDAIAETFSTRTTGERGFSLTTNVNAGRTTKLRYQWLTHKEAPEAPAIHDWTVRAQIRLSDLILTPFARGRSLVAGRDTYAVGSYAVYGDADRRLDARAEFGRHRTGADIFLRLGLGLRWRVTRHLHLAPAVRWVDPDLDIPGDGYWYLYLTETALPASGGRIEAALVWQRYEDRTREDRIEVRLRMAAYRR